MVTEDIAELVQLLVATKLERAEGCCTTNENELRSRSWWQRDSRTSGWEHD